MYRKTLSLNDCEIKLKSDGTHFAGYASTFGGVDAYGDTIKRGAYAETLAAHGMPKMFVQHDSRSLPIGKWLSAKEDERGLAVEGEFTPGMLRAEEVRAALRHGTVDGLSIGYMLKKSDYEETAAGRIINNVSKLLEISIVTFPADGAARVDTSSVKAEDIEQLETIRDFERFLRDVGAFDQVTAKRLVAKLRAIPAQRDVGEEGAKAVADLSRAITGIQERIRAGI